MIRKLPPKFYRDLAKDHPEVFDALESLGKATRAAGPIDEGTAHLIQLAAAAATRSEGAVHSHTRRAIAAGVKPEAIRHALLLLLTTIGTSKVVSAISWAEDVLAKE
jgi:4-carboxymuconolactone decarboxylase